MLRQTQLRHFITLLLIASVFLASLNIWASLKMDEQVRLLEDAEEYLFDAMRLSEMLRQSSDELTQFARKYVTTGEPIYLQRFRQVLGIRDSTIPRPNDYDGIYWELINAGRLALHEVFVINDNIRDIIAKNASILDVEEESRKIGFITIRYDGIMKVLQGLSSIEEVDRVTAQ